MRVRISPPARARFTDCQGGGTRRVSSGPIVFIGPGSEWFWSMAQFVLVGITLVGIYLQLRLQRAANIFDHLARLSDEFQAEMPNRAKVSAAQALLRGDHVPTAALTVIGNFWDRVAFLVRHGDLNVRGVHDPLGSSCRFWWELMAEDIHRLRSTSEASDVYADFEWLAGEFARLAERKGSIYPFDRASLIAGLPEDIEGWQGRIRMSEDSRRAPAPRKRTDN